MPRARKARAKERAKENEMMEERVKGLESQEEEPRGVRPRKVDASYVGESTGHQSAPRTS